MSYDFAFEEQFANKVIGVDEVGRGPLAGPVVCAAILCDKSIMNCNVKDSKKLSKAKRQFIFSQLINNFEYLPGIREVSVHAYASQHVSPLSLPKELKPQSKFS